jgi:Ca2+-binding RTX toxin-like protein
MVVTLVASILAPISPTSAGTTCLGRTVTVEGTANDDQLTGTSGVDVIAGLGGNDTISGGEGNDIICGSAGNDALFGEFGNDVVSGDAGRDQVSGGLGADQILGGKGADYVNYFVSQAPVDVDLAAGTADGEGADTLEGIENIFGSIFGDDLVGNGRENSIQPLDGDDDVNGGGGIDLIYDGTGPGSEGSDGNDSLDGGPSFDGVLYTTSTSAIAVDLANGSAEGNGNDALAHVEGIFGSRFGDVLNGDDGRNLFLGLGGDDEIDGRGGGDAVAYWLAEGRVTADLASGQGSANGEGTDSFSNVEGLLGSVLFGDELSGDDGNNYVDGDGGNDDLAGLGGNDWLVGGPGNDTIEGGAGDYDLVDYSNTAFLEIVAAVEVDLAAGKAQGQGNDSLSEVEAVMGSSLDDELVGDSNPNRLFGMGGDDDIRGAGGDDFLSGGAGPDKLNGGPGSDSCARGEQVSACEGKGEPPEHPVLDDAEEIEAARRNFRRNF